jgi:hypothetical protein
MMNADGIRVAFEEQVKQYVYIFMTTHVIGCSYFDVLFVVDRIVV